MTYKECDEMATKLEEMAAFIRAHGVQMPYFTPTTQFSCYLTVTDYKRGENGEYETIIDEDATKQNIKKFLAAVGNCTKDYSDDKLVITKKYSNGDVMIRGNVDRSIACKKVITGKKFVPATFIQARMEDEYEWKCDEGISLLKLVQ